MLRYILLSAGAFFFLSLIIRCRQNSFYRYLFELEKIFEMTPDFTSVSDSLLKALATETRGDAGIIYYFDKVRNKFTLKTFYGVKAEEISAITQTLSHKTGAFELMLKNPPLLTTQTLKVDTGGFKKFSDGFFKGALVSPLRAHDHIHGVIVLLKKSSGFSRKDLKLLRHFSPRAAVWLENARLYQLAKDTAWENAKLYNNLYRLHGQATRDELTGLFNRHLLLEELKKTLRFEKPLSLILTDLDSFKKINDDFGHQVGDEALKEFGALLTTHLRETDKAYRYGGEEFMILLPETEIEEAMKIAERLREKTAAFVFCHLSGGIEITASFGVSSFPETPGVFPVLTEKDLNLQIERLIKAADKALYRAKEAGRNRVESFSG